MRHNVCWLLFGIFLAIFAAGCGGDSGTAPEPGAGEAPADSSPSADDAAPTADASPAGAEPAEGTPASPATDGDAGSFALTPDNTVIQFVGIHSGDKPDPRTGTFGAFTGNAAIEEGQLKSLQVDIDTTSLQTDIEKLTNHLKSPDFFNVNEHPKATYVSTEIGPITDGKVAISGNLTLLGQTKPVNFEAEVSLEDGLKLKGEFTIDRTEFGMDYSVDRVEKAVSMTVTVGH